MIGLLKVGIYIGKIYRERRGGYELYINNYIFLKEFYKSYYFT